MRLSGYIAGQGAYRVAFFGIGAKEGWAISPTVVMVDLFSAAQADAQPRDQGLGVKLARVRAAQGAVAPDDFPDLHQFYLTRINDQSLGEVLPGLFNQRLPIL